MNVRYWQERAIAAEALLAASADFKAYREQREQEHDLAVAYFDALDRLGQDYETTAQAYAAMRAVTDKMSENQAFVAYCERKRAMREHTLGLKQS